MRNKQRNWQLFRLAKTWGCRPSELLGIEDPYHAYCLDEAITYYGEALESEIEIQTEKAKSKKAAQAKAQFILDRWLGKHDAPDGKKKFRSPAPTK